MAKDEITGDAALQSGYDACIDHANQLLQSAHSVWEQTGYAHIAYVLAVFALEEVGKAELLKIQTVKSITEDRFSPEKASEIHAKKLFWALWSNTLISKKPIPKEIEELRGFATLLHETRLAANYVDPFSADGTPDTAVSEAFLKNLLALVRTRIDAAREFVFQQTSGESRVLLNWFIASYQNKETRASVFDQASVKMLYELGDYLAWVKWLKERSDAMIAEGSRLAKLEIDRPRSDSKEYKWNVTIRLHCQSHSIRPKVFNEWNIPQLAYLLFCFMKRSRLIVQARLLG